jgi:HlyD family secretion protein
MFRDSSAQDRVIERTALPWLRRYPLLLTVLAGITLALLLFFWKATPWSTGLSVNVGRLSIATVESGRFVRDIAAEGRIVAAVSPKLYAAASGTVAFSARAGESVTQGQVLGTINSPDLQNQLAQAEGALHELTIAYERAQIDAREQAMLADQRVETALIERNFATTENERTLKAFFVGAIPEIMVKRTQATLDKAQLSYDHECRDREMRGKLRVFDVDAKRVARDRQNITVEELRREVGLLTLRSPVSGQMGQLLVAERSYVAKDTPLLSVVDLTALAVDVAVPEGFARDLVAAMPAEISAVGRELKGEIASVAPEVVNGEVVARVRFADEAPTGLRQNQRVSVRILLDTHDHALMVTRGPFVELDSGRTVYVVHGQVAERQPIHVGASSVDKVEILEGVQAGDRIVIAGSERFNGAQRVFLNQ